MPIVLCGGCSTEVCNSTKPCQTPQESYVGAVLDTFERNGYDDSDFCAVVWDEDTQAVTSREYGTTRSWTYHNYAAVDATPQVREKALAWYRREWANRLVAEARQEAANPVVKTRRVRSLTTRGNAKGVTGTVGWIGENRYAKPWDTGAARLRVGIDPDGGGDRVFVTGDRLEVVAPEPVDEHAVRTRATTATPPSWQSGYRSLTLAA